MLHVPLLDELAVIATLGVVMSVLLARLRLPTVAGLLLSGALAGPRALGLVSSMTAIEVLAEVGVVLLLFSIGLEFSLARLWLVLRQVALGGALQVGATTLLVMGVAVAGGLGPREGLFFGFVFALSSTAIVLKALEERRELEAPHGRFIVGALLFQDLCVVPMVLVVPLLAPGAGEGWSAVWGAGRALLLAAGVVAVVVAASRTAVPWVLDQVDRTRSKEVFLLALLGLCLGTAWLTALGGLSLALGAFLAGMAVAGTPYHHRAMGEVRPLRDAFVSLFFVSLGMLFDLRVVVAQPWLALGLTLAFVVGKGVVATAAALVMRFPSRVAWLAGVGLAQFGEFGFVLAQLGQRTGVVGEATLQPVLAAGIVSMFLTPLLVRLAPHFSAGEALLAPLARLLRARALDVEGSGTGPPPSGHVVLVGYGLAGHRLGQALKAAGVETLALELNAETVRNAQAAGEPVYLADATSAEALGHAHLAGARALVVAMNDPEGLRRVLAAARDAAPGVPVLVRTRFLSDVPALEALGAVTVVVEEAEAAHALQAAVMAALARPAPSH